MASHVKAAMMDKEQAMTDKEQYERQQEEVARFAQSEGATYYDPDSPVVWKQYIIGPVPLWRRILWWFLPPSHRKMRQIQQRRSDKGWKDVWKS